MYKLNYEELTKLHESHGRVEKFFTTVDKALEAIKSSVEDPDKVILSDYSTEDYKEFRWLHVKQKHANEDNYYYQLNSLVFVGVDDATLHNS